MKVWMLTGDKTATWQTRVPRKILTKLEGHRTFLFPPSQNTARLVLSEETAINIGVATGLLAAEQGKAERPMSLRPEVFMGRLGKGFWEGEIGGMVSYLSSWRCCLIRSLLR